ncbi:ABC transporter ATP-binding protein [Kineosporia sp. R_H_3]|uniref:ABC transporter ATP-binding protein n=1 Tax=Kineosporia sp. R_H_3 TaxID=1961848 RepID=UPI000B4B67B6|nr:ABC transporter ATP-binding protein [Kineosporia sp. R_H_3]
MRLRLRERPAPQAPPTAWGGALLEVQGVGVTLGRARVLDGVDLTVEPRRWTAIVGPNGAGKSTLLRVVAGLQKHDGRVLVDGADVGLLAPRERAARIGYAPQVPVLPDGVAVREYVLLGRTPYHPLLSSARDADREIAQDALDRLDLGPLADRPLRTLSGGERQRAVLARALAQQPRLLLLDEPTAALDLGHAQQLLELVDELRREDGLTVLSTLHDLALAGQYAERLVLLDGGRVVTAGAPGEVLTSSALARHYGATAEVVEGPDGLRVHPVRPARPARTARAEEPAPSVPTAAPAADDPGVAQP